MKYFLPLDDQANPGRIPVLDVNNKAHYIVLGHMNQVNRTLFLNDLNRNEVGRITNTGENLANQFLLVVHDAPPLQLKQLKLGIVNLYYLSELNYWISGNTKNNEYTFRHGRDKIAKATLMVTNLGPTMQVNIFDDTAEEAVILTSLIFNQPSFVERLLRKKKAGINYQPTF